MLVVSILFVLIGQLSYSVSLDRALAENHLRDTQARFDLRSATEIFLAAIEREGEGPELDDGEIPDDRWDSGNADDLAMDEGAEALEEEGYEEGDEGEGSSGSGSIEVELPSGKARIRWTSESGKFNINSLRAEDPTIPLEQFERLFQVLEEHGSVTELGLANQIADFVTAVERPLLGIRELKQIESITDEVLDGGGGSEGLTKYLTVYSDGQVNVGDAPVEVIAALDESLNNEKTLALLIRKIKEPRYRVPDYVSRLAERLESSVTTDSRAYLATITLSGNHITRKIEVAARKEEEGFRLLLFNELGETHETDDE